MQAFSIFLAIPRHTLGVIAWGRAPTSEGSPLTVRWHRINRKAPAAALVAVLSVLGFLGSGANISSVRRAQLSAVFVPPADKLLTVSETQAERKEAGVTPFSSQPQLTYHGGNGGIGITSGTPKVYLVFWGSQWGSSSVDGNGDTNLSGDTSNIAPRLQRFFKGVGTSSEQWSGTMTQYCEGVSYGATACPDGGGTHVGYPTGGAYAGIWVDTSNAAPNAASQNQLGAEAVAAAAHFGNTSSNSNRSTQYVVVSPHGTHPDGFNAGGGFCAWHSYVSSAYGILAFTNLPYIPDMGWQCGANFVNAGAGGALDGVTVVEGHEYSETITDPTLAAWWDANGQENADKCAWLGGGGTGGLQNYTFTTGSYAVQGSWSNDTADCRVAHAIYGVGASDFSINASAMSSTAQGATGRSTISTAISSGSSLSVALSATDVPSGVTASFDNNSIASGTSATLSLAVGANVPAGHYTVHVTGTGNNGLSTLTRTVAVALTVTVGNDFALTSSSATGRQGATATASIATTTSLGSAQPVTLSLGTLPAGVTGSFGTNPVNSGSASLLTFTIGANVVPGNYTVVVTGSGSSGGTSETHTVSVPLSVTVGNDFSVTAATGTARQGASAVVNIATRTTIGSAQPVTLSVAGAPAGVTASFGTNPVTSGSNSAMRLAVGATVVPGRYTMTVTGRGSSGGTPESRTSSTTLTVTLGNDFSVTGGSASTRQGTSAVVSVATHTTVGSAQPVTMSIAGVPSGVTASFGTNPVTSDNATALTLAVGANVAPGRYTMTVTGHGSSGGVAETHTATVTLTVTLGNDFALTGGSAAGLQSTTPSVSITTRTTIGSAQAVTLSLSALPSGVTASFDTNPVTSGNTATLTFTIAGNAAPGRYPLTVTGTGTSGLVSLSHSVSVVLTITVPRAHVIRF